MILLKSKADLLMLRESGKILGKILKALQKAIKPGITTAEIDKLAEDLLLSEKVLAAFKGYKGFPASTCVSLNEEVVHGIPSGRVIQDGDIVSVDFGLNYRGYFSDAAFTLGVGKLDSRVKKLMAVAKAALSEGIKQAVPENHLFDISYAIQNYVEKNGFSVVRQFVGHGIGRNLHEEPEIPNFGMKGRGPVLKSGMVFAIEPMVNMGTWECEILENGWTAVTADRRPSAHFEHTVAITESGPEILTRDDA
ncbi:MAG: type I methionyl aminopeptidase [Candidatus Omnitrophica bacterium]|nr:type I methionyl aminopeptidase [Candidatus Omnitrophota bacterium]MDD5653008.1 type I methionyl aminopeptidase [Candidatus Omnitrophota bacterium]